jgi:Co/Zn/Cd efflux system component
VLWAVLLINAAMFAIESGAGLLAHSTSLLADSLDMLGDTLVYGFSLYAITRGAWLRGVAALLKGAIMAAFGVGVLLDVIGKALSSGVPHAPTMGVIGALALAANLLCFVLLYRFRSDDLNMRSTWLCSRNDIVANSSVLLAALAVSSTQSRWPDLLVGVLIVALFLQSAYAVMTQAVRQLRQEGPKHIILEQRTCCSSPSCSCGHG